MNSDETTALLVFGAYCAPFAYVLWRIRVEARETRALLLDIERAHRQKFESLEGEFASLRIKHFGLFRVRRPPHKAEDWHWTVAEVEEERDSTAPKA
jgi:hypothetical protein